MPTFTLFGKSVELEAVPVTSRPTRDMTAWLNECYISVRMTRALRAIRVHTAGRSFPGRSGSRQEGAWLLIGDVIRTASGIADSRSLPTADPTSMTAFTHTSEAVVAPGAVLNIGLASAKFGGLGGGFQAEFVDGPPVAFVPLAGMHWHGVAGHS